MNNSVYRFALDLHTSQSQVSIPVKLHETGRQLHIYLSDGDKPYFIKDECLAKISIKRPTGTHLAEFCNIERNTVIVYDFAQNANTAAVEGIHECDVTLYGVDGRILGSPRFTMIVSERVIRSDDIEVTDEDYTAVDAMLAEEAQRQVHENQRISDEQIRASAESTRIEAEAERHNAEVARASAEGERSSAELARNEAEVERSTTEGTRKTNELTRISNENARIANENERVAKDAERDSAISNAVQTSENALKKSNDATEAVEEFREEIGSEALIEDKPTIKGAVNYAVSTANSAFDQVGVVRTNLINLSAQVQGIGRSYVVPNFLYFIDFLNAKKSVELKEDRDGDGSPETYHISISDLKTGDNIIIIEKGVPDFWFEKNAALSIYDTFPYNGVEYTLSAKVSDVVIGGAHILETDYTVIEGFSISAAASANEALGFARNASSSEGNAKASENNAKLSENNAKDSENAAKESETNAKASEIAAQLAEEEAKAFVNSLGIAQGKGTSETLVMSQKAVTEELNEITSEASKKFSNALKGKERGGIVSLPDISPIPHTLDVKIRSKNLVPYPYNETTKTKDGITFTVNGNGSITVVGEATANFVPFNLTYNNVFEEGKTYILSEYMLVSYRTPSGTKYAGGGPVVHTLKWEKGYAIGQIYYQIAKSEGYVNRTYYPYIVEATDTAEYTPFVDVSTVKVRAQGKNLIGHHGESFSSNGVTAIPNADGSFTLNGTSTGEAFFLLTKDIRLREGIYTISGGTADVRIIAMKNGSSWIESVHPSIPASGAFNKGDVFTHIGIYIPRSGITANNLVIYPQLELNSEATEYEPYIEPVEYAVNADGTVDNLNSIYPTTVLSADSENVTIEASYNKDANKVVASLEDRIAALEAMIINN